MEGMDPLSQVASIANLTAGYDAQQPSAPLFHSGGSGGLLHHLNPMQFKKFFKGAGSAEGDAGTIAGDLGTLGEDIPPVAP